MSILIPTWVRLVMAGTITVVTFGAGWTVRDWKRDAEVLASIEDAAAQVKKQTDRIDVAAATYEKERADADVRSTVRESTIREIYKDRPVSVDCAVPDVARSVLGDAVREANARAAGQSAATVPSPAAATSAVDRP
ncbi:hypothetical protein [Novosphingobium decolorationis]|nr:hypothetical protein [Novosphingobium decolorationis]